MATSDGANKSNEHNERSDASTSDASQEMFEKMFMDNVAAKKRTVMGGAMFVDMARGQFFQRAFLESKIDDLRTEMREGLPEIGDDGNKSVSTVLPFGSWEVRLVETNEDTASITITFCAGDEDGETPDDDDSKALRSKLRLERTFHLPPTADLTSAEVTIDGRRVSVTARDKEKVPVAAKESRPRSPTSIVDGEAMAMQIEIE